MYTPMNEAGLKLNINDIETLIDKLNKLQPTENFDLTDINETKLCLLKYKAYLERIQQTI